MSAYTQTEIERLRSKAKELGIKHWHLKKPENLEEELESMNTISSDDKIPKISFGQAMDYLDQLSIDKMEEAFEALDTLKEKRSALLAKEIEAKVLSLGEDREIEIEALKKWCEVRLKFSFTDEFFFRVLDDLTSLFGNKGWYYDDEFFYALDKPYFPLSWHLDRWNEVHNSKGKQVAHRIFSILLQGDEDDE